MHANTIHPSSRRSVAASSSSSEPRTALLPTVRSGEEKSVALFFAYAFALMVCLYVLKTLREPLLLTGGSAEAKSYAAGAIAFALLALMPVYGMLFRRTASVALVRGITAFFAANVVLFYVLGQARLDVAFAYYVWCGVFNVTMVAQLWAHAAHSFDVPSGERLFPVIMMGATVGAVVAPPLTGALFPLLGPWNLMLAATALLIGTLPLIRATRAAVPEHARNRRTARQTTDGKGANGFAPLLGDRYLWLLAALVVLLNCVNSIGEFILTDHVLRIAEARAAADSSVAEASVIAAFYGNFYFAVNTLAVVIQVLLAARIFRFGGIAVPLLVLPTIAVIGYVLIAFVPIFSVIRVVKVLENGINYSVMNTARHALFLPLPAAQQYQGKTAVDTFFWRVGDLLQAGFIYAGLHWLGLEVRGFALLNVALAGVWIAVAVEVAHAYACRSADVRSAGRRRWFKRAALAAGGLAAAAASADTASAPRALFAEHAPLKIDLVTDIRGFCRNPTTGCADSPAQIVYRGGDGREHLIDVSLRARGRWRRDTSDCSWPALFVHVSPQSAEHTPFEGESMLPLTTHCRDSAPYEQYLLKEYLAYRIYNELTDASLRVRLVQITYRDTTKPGSTKERLAFFSEHFDALAARHGASVVRPADVDVERLDRSQLGTLELFQYMIGNTDWSAVYGHNTVHLRRAGGDVIAVPYDFDFSGLVDAAYAGPAPQLPIRNVKELLFRGSCRPEAGWESLFALFESRRADIIRLPAEVPRLEAAHAARSFRYLDGFFAILSSPHDRTRKIVGVCRDGAAARRSPPEIDRAAKVPTSLQSGGAQ
jgi:AAA family ATP:ADP antiporter